MTQFDRVADVSGALCWSCHQPVSPLALFCGHCGSLQPPASLDPFTRLGLHRDFVVDRALLDRQYAGFRQRVGPDRFAERSLRERDLARQQAGALEEAYETLRDPVKRAVYLLRTLGRHVDVAAAGGDDPALLGEVAELAEALADADSAETVDRLADRVDAEAERCQQLMAEAFAVDELDLVATLVVRLHHLEALGVEAAAAKSRLAR